MQGQRSAQRPHGRAARRWTVVWAIALVTAASLVASGCSSATPSRAALVRGVGGVTATVAGWTATRTVGLICPAHPGDAVTLTDEWRQHLRDAGCLDLGLRDGPFPNDPGWDVTFHFTQAERMRPFQGRTTYFIVLLSPEATFVGPVPAVDLLMPQAIESRRVA
jgi:hypothetical protein